MPDKSIKLYSTWFVISDKSGKPLRKYEWSGYASSKNHAFAKMISDTSVQMQILLAFDEELLFNGSGEDLFIWTIRDA